MDGLAREVCQNSLDAKDKDLGDAPVKVKFEIISIHKSAYQVFSEYEKYVDQSIEYWKHSPLHTPEIKEFLEHVKDALSVEEIPVLVMSDYNTVSANWMKLRANEWSISRHGTMTMIFVVDNTGKVMGHSPDSYTNAARPVFYLQSTVTYVSGTGTSSNPYRID